MPDKPFFVYLAPGGTHAPHAVHKEWSDKYQGKFDQGWDKLREENRPKQIPAWDDMPEALKPVLARQMEIYAGYMEHTDFQLGRVVDALKEMEILGDTLIIDITGDNGGSGEGGPTAASNWMIPINGASAIETPELMAARIDKFGTPDALNHFAVGWAHAMDTPYQWIKQVASHWGGTRQCTLVHWPNGFKARGELRTQFSHVIDVASTVLDAAGIPEPDFVNGIQQAPLEGKSLVPSFADPKAPEFRETQYFEMVGNRRHLSPGLESLHQAQHAVDHDGRGSPEFDDDVWNSMGPTTGPRPITLRARCQKSYTSCSVCFSIEAVRYNVLPLHDRRSVKFNADIAGRPELIRGNMQTLVLRHGRPPGKHSSSTPRTSRCTHRPCRLSPKESAPRVSSSRGRHVRRLEHLREGRPPCLLLQPARQYSKIEGKKRIPAGEHQVRMEFTYDGGGLGKGATINLYVDGEKNGEGRVDRSTPNLSR